MAAGPTHLVRRLRAALRRYGARESALMGARLVRRRVDYRETYIWFELVLDGERPRPPLGDGLRLAEVDDALLEPFHRTESTTPAQTARYRERGGRPWLVLEGDQPAFACWTHPSSTPLRISPEWWLDLPPKVACLEDSITAPDFRGRGIAPQAWAAIADRLREEGFTAMITKVQDTNVPSCRAVTKAGFVEVARMHVRENGPRVRLRTSAGSSATGAELARRLEGSTLWLFPRR